MEANGIIEPIVKQNEDDSFIGYFSFAPEKNLFSKYSGESEREMLTGLLELFTKFNLEASKIALGTYLELSQDAKKFRIFCPDNFFYDYNRIALLNDTWDSIFGNESANPFCIHYLMLKEKEDPERLN